MKPTPIFSKIETGSKCYDDVKATYTGISIKTFISLALTMLVAIVVATFMILSINKAITENPEDTEIAMKWLTASSVLAIVSVIIAFISALVGRLSDKAAKVCIFIYSISEGFVLGFITGIVEAVYPNQYIGALAVFGTLVIFTVMLLLFVTGVLRVGSFLRRFLAAVLITAVALGLFTILFILFSGLLSTYSTNIIWLILLIETLYLVYACFSLIYSFNEAQAVVESGCRKESEWSVALGLLITLAYIYLQLLRIIVLLLQIFGKRN